MTDVAGLIVNGSEPLYKKVNEISRQEAAVHLCFTHINYSSELPAVHRESDKTNVSANLNGLIID